MTKREYLEILEKTCRGLDRRRPAISWTMWRNILMRQGKRKPWRRWDHRRAVPVR